MIGEHKHDVKIKLHNTKCSLDVAAFHAVVSQRFHHLQDLTVGEYFAKFIITKLVDTINAQTDITKLNDLLRRMAPEGKKAACGKLAPKKSCNSCDKEVKSTASLTCTLCNDVYHVSCLSLAFTNVKQLSIEKEFQCGNCQVYPERAIEYGTNKSLQILTEQKLSTILSFLLLPWQL